jgi:uncharacterized protein (TIGR03083 family)
MPAEHTDEELVAMLDQVWGSMADLGRELTEEQWKTPTEVPGWTVQDNLTHITGLEWSLLGRPAPEHAVPDDLAHVKNDFGKLNEVFVDSRRPLPGADALDEFVETTHARIAQLRGFGPDDFDKESWTPGGPGTVRTLLPFRIFDSWVHEQDMRRAVGRAGNLESPAAELAMGRVFDAMPFVVGKKASAPDGSTVAFELSGPLARTFVVGVDGGRAKMLDDAPSDAQTRIVTDTETLGRLGVGRVDPAAARGDGRVRIEGDQELGARIVDGMNFLF